MTPSRRKIIFVTGTDTGVGKTLLTALLLHHLRSREVRALAMKPFCSGGRADVNLLQSLQPGELSDAEMNPFYFPEPVAPLVSTRLRRKKIRLPEVIQRIREVQNRCDTLIVEGSGGVLVPLGEGFTVLDLISALRAQVIVVGRNKLGTINHTLLTSKVLKDNGLRIVSVVLMDPARLDDTAQTNQKILSELLSVPVLRMSFLGNKIKGATQVEDCHKKVKKMLAGFLG